MALTISWTLRKTKMMYLHFPGSQVSVCKSRSTHQATSHDKIDLFQRLRFSPVKMVPIMQFEKKVAKKSLCSAREVIGDSGPLSACLFSSLTKGDKMAPTLPKFHVTVYKKI